MSSTRSNEHLIEDDHRPEVIRLHETEEEGFRYKKRNQRKDGYERSFSREEFDPIESPSRQRHAADYLENGEPYQFSNSYPSWSPPRRFDESDPNHLFPVRKHDELGPSNSASRLYRRKETPPQEPQEAERYYYTKKESFPEDELYQEAYKANKKTQECIDVRRQLSSRHSSYENDSFPSIMESEVSSSHTDNSWSGDEVWIRTNTRVSDSVPDTVYEHPYCYSEPADANNKTIEVAPGQFMKLRGADESWKAIQVDYIMPCECVCCDKTLFCIQDAEFCLCPDCKTILPMEGERGGGVGLGFGLEDLHRWQTEIEQQRARTKYY